MDEETTKHAALIAAVVCRIVDYHVAMQMVSRIATTPEQLSACNAPMQKAEKSVADAIATCIDQGALK